MLCRRVCVIAFNFRVKESILVALLNSEAEESALRFFETLGTTQALMQFHIPEDLHASCIIIV
jgi:hypothetical protein